MSKAFARGACPGLSAPMSTGDGLLARLVVAGPVPLDAFVDLCDAARMHGNGIMEISARGSLQVRGLNAVSAPLFAAAVEALDIDLCESVPVLCDPLPDDPTALIESQAIAASLRQAIADAALALAPKVSVVIDGGGRIGLDAVPADIRLRATPTSEGPRTPCRTRRRCLERDGSRRHRPARRGRCRAGFALDHRRHGDRGARRRSAAAA